MSQAKVLCRMGREAADLLEMCAPVSAVSPPSCQNVGSKKSHWL